MRDWDTAGDDRQLPGYTAAGIFLALFVVFTIGMLEACGEQREAAQAPRSVLSGMRYEAKDGQCYGVVVSNNGHYGEVVAFAPAAQERCGGR